MGFTDYVNSILVFYLGLCVGMNENRDYNDEQPAPERYNNQQSEIN